MNHYSKALLEQILKLSKNHRKLLHYFFRCSKTMKEIFFSISYISKTLDMGLTCVRDFFRENGNLIVRFFRKKKSSIFKVSKEAVDCITFLEREGVWNMNRRQRMQWLYVQKANPSCSKSEPYSSSYPGKNCSPISEPALALLDLPRSAQQILVKIGMNAYDMTKQTIKDKSKRKEPIHDIEAYACHIFSKRLRRVSDRIIRSL